MRLYLSFLTVGGLTMISRVLGFARDILIAALLGSGAVADAFFVAFRLPNLFRRLFGEGAFNSAFVPLFAKRLEGDGPDAARAFAEQAMSGLLLILVVLSAAFMVAMPWLMHGLAPGFADTPEKFDLAVLLAQIAFPYLAFMSMVALLSGILNSMGRFIASSAISIVLNLTLIAAILLALAFGFRNEPTAGVFLAWGVFAAGVFQFLLLAWGVRRSAMKLRLVRPRWNDDMRRLVTLGIPGLIAGGITQVNIVIGTVIASLQDSAVSHLYYADRVYELPLALVGIAIGIVLLPDLSKSLRAGDEAAVQESQNRALEFAMLLTIPAAVALSVAALPIVSVLFQRGAFDATDTQATGMALAIFAAGLPAFVLIKVLSPAFFAREDTRTPMRFAVISLTINTLLSVALFFAFREAGFMPHLGIATATVIGGWLNAALLWRGLRQRGQFTLDSGVRSTLPMMILSAIVMGIGLWGSAAYLAPYLELQQPVQIRFAALAVLVVSGIVVYLAAAYASGALNVKAIRAAIRRQ